MKLTLAFLFASGAMAACPNACSQHGECGEFDSCDCHAGFQGGDCSERVCMYNWAWVTTANGDLNFDSDRYDGTVYSETTRIDATVANTATVGFGGQVLLTQANPGGSWESWPYYGSPQEGHYYMECSNRGLCDRTSGDCVCFDGYTGTACNRMVCPEDCSEHGICQTVKDYDAIYKLWDRDMARSCKCDPGYTGPACQTRICPHGNDPLTKTNEVFESQFVDIYSACAGSGTTTDCGTFGATTAQLSGYVRLTYTDHFGEAYTTDPVAVQTMDSSSGAHAVATNVQTALRALPNNVVSSTLTVTAQYCETTVDAITDPGTDATGYTDHPFRILDATKGAGGTDNTAVYATDGKVLVTGSSGQTVFDAGAVTGGNTQLAALPNPMCIRLRVDFTDMPGDLNTLTVDHSEVTYFGETNAQNTNARVGSNVVSDLQITGGSTSALTVGYTRPTTVQVASSGAAQIDIASKTITAAASTYGQDVNGYFHMNSKIRIECEYQLNGVATYRNLGVYTVSTSTAPTDTVITVKETIVANTCTAASSTVRITQVSNVITIGQHNLGLTTTLSAGHRIRLIVVSGSAIHEVDTTVASIEYHNDGTNDIGYIILAEEASNVLLADITAGAAALYHDGDGTRENVECSDRGMCGEDGICKCFAGYTGDDCSVQKAIAM